MKTIDGISLMSLAAESVQPDTAVSNGPVSYIIGGIIALLVMGYLIYTLLHPEKF
jgi:K+-transporting ATPase KdpF subunit